MPYNLLMIILQYKCNECSSLFEYLYGAMENNEVNCIKCGSHRVERADEVPFYANKNFCPNSDGFDPEEAKLKLNMIMSDKSEQCTSCVNNSDIPTCKGGGGCGGKCKNGGGGCGGCGKGK